MLTIIVENTSTSKELKSFEQTPHFILVSQTEGDLGSSFRSIELYSISLSSSSIRSRN